MASNKNNNNQGVTAAVTGGAEKSTAERRRSSASGSKFAGLVNQKRNSTDIAGSARKASFLEQKPVTGFLGSWWHNFTKGN